MSTPFAADAIGDEHRWRRANRESLQSRVMLTWSEQCYLAAIVLALLLVLLPPEWRFPYQDVIKHLSLALTLPFAFLSLIGGGLATPSAGLRYDVSKAIAALIPFLLLGAWIVVGSLHARLVEGWSSNFLNLGLYMVAACAAAIMVVSSATPSRLVSMYVRLLLISALCMSAGLIALFGVREIYHEQIFLVIPLAAFALLHRDRKVLGTLGGVVLLGITLFSRKNTSYLIALLTVFYLALILWLPQIRRAAGVKQMWAQYLLLVCVLTITAVVCYLLYFRENYLPSGNVEFRAFTYRLAWQTFLDSPLWGTLFNAESVHRFTLYSIGISHNRLPTHSDFMDLLANGGLLAMTLWAWGYCRVARLTIKSKILSPSNLRRPCAAQAHTLALISIAAIITYAFNPLLLQPADAYLVWTALGFLVGIAIRNAPTSNDARNRGFTT